jgi:hypothetical protein
VNSLNDSNEKAAPVFHDDASPNTGAAAGATRQRSVTDANYRNANAQKLSFVVTAAAVAECPRNQRGCLRAAKSISHHVWQSVFNLFSIGGLSGV